MSLLRKQQNLEANRITDEVYNTMRDRFGVKLISYPAVRRRVAELLDAYDNPDMVAVVMQEIVARDGPEFSPMSVSYIRAGELIQATRMADEAWEYERWSRTLEPGLEPQVSAEFWLAAWRDAYRAGETTAAAKARGELSHLKGKHRSGEDTPMGSIER